MTPVQNLHYAIGELAYAIAATDGTIQREEYEKFHNIVEAEIRMHDPDFEVSDIVFQLLNRDHVNVEEAYNSAMRIIKTNSHYLSPKLKETFIRVIQKVAMAFSPSTLEEMEFVNRFMEEIEPIHGDPVYYDHAC